MFCAIPERQQHHRREMLAWSIILDAQSRCSRYSHSAAGGKLERSHTVRRVPLHQTCEDVYLTVKLDLREAELGHWPRILPIY